MSIFVQEELWVVVQESERPNAPSPKPLASGFSPTKAYRVLGIHSASETSEAYFILCNDRNEVWFISNQHFRVYGGEAYSKPSEEEAEEGELVSTRTNGKNGYVH